MVRAIAVRAADGAVPLAVEDGVATVPEELSFPWTVASSRFEASTYTAEDFAAGKPLVVKQLGVIEGVIRRDGRQEKSVWLLHRTTGDRVDEIDFTPAADGTFALSVAAGTYDTTVIGASCATRIRSGVIVSPGRTTDVGALVCEPAAPLAFRVIDAQNGGPVRGAKVTWDPPQTMYSNVAAAMYRDRWTRMTDRAGLVVFAAVGPIPLPVRWRIEAQGYATEHTRSLVISNAETVRLPDVRIRPDGQVLVRVELPRDARGLENCRLVFGDERADRMFHFNEAASAPLRRGDVRFRFGAYGRKRLWVEDTAHRKLAYRDFDANSQLTVVDFRLSPIVLHGAVRRGAEGVEGALITVSSPVDASMIIGRTQTDPAGLYRLEVFASGKTLVYATPAPRPGVEVGATWKRVELGDSVDQQIDFDVPESEASVKVIDGETAEPVKARVDAHLAYAAGGAVETSAETDSDGSLRFVGEPEGTATLLVHASGYRSRSVEVALRPNGSTVVVPLHRAAPTVGRVIDDRGVPVAGAHVVAGFATEMSMPQFETLSDSDGRFRFDASPDPGTSVYVAAAGFALGTGVLEDGRENTIVLTAPHAGFVYVYPNNAPPIKKLAVVAAPERGEFIPSYALILVAQANGMTDAQLQATAKDGAVTLPEFLAPGRYALFVVEVGKSTGYRKIGTVDVPSTGNVTLAFASP